MGINFWGNKMVETEEGRTKGLKKKSIRQIEKGWGDLFPVMIHSMG